MKACMGCVKEAMPISPIAARQHAATASKTAGKPKPVCRIGLGGVTGRHPGSAARLYRGSPNQPPKTGTFYSADNRNFLLCFDVGPA